MYHAMVLQLYMPLSMFVSMEQRWLERLNSPCYSKLNRNVILAPSMTFILPCFQTSLRVDLVTRGSREDRRGLRGKWTNFPLNPLQSSRDPGSPNQFSRWWKCADPGVTVLLQLEYLFPTPGAWGISVSSTHRSKSEGLSFSPFCN